MFFAVALGDEGMQCRKRKLENVAEQEKMH